MGPKLKKSASFLTSGENRPRSTLLSNKDDSIEDASTEKSPTTRQKKASTASIPW